MMANTARQGYVRLLQQTRLAPNTNTVSKLHEAEVKGAAKAKSRAELTANNLCEPHFLFAGTALSQRPVTWANAANADRLHKWPDDEASTGTLARKTGEPPSVFLCCSYLVHPASCGTKGTASQH
jgi:hypothetical protein